MIANDVSRTETVRNVFIIDEKGIIRLILMYPLNVGRCIPEIIRAIKAIQVADCEKCSTPANWCTGEPVIIPKPNTYCELEERLKYINEHNNGISWYLSFKNQSFDCTNITSNQKNHERKLL